MALFQGLSPITRRRLTIFRRHRRGFVSLCLFLAIFAVTLLSNVIANDRPLVLSYKGELLFPLIHDYPDDKFGGFLPVADFRNKDTADEINAHGWMFWPPIRFSYATVHYVAATTAPAPPTWALSKQQCEAAGAAEAGRLGGPNRGCATLEPDWLGTDSFQRDVLARVLYGARASILFGLALTFFASMIGVTAGAIQGYFGGWTDLLFQRFIEIWSSLPSLYVLIIVSSFFTPRTGDAALHPAAVRMGRARADRPRRVPAGGGISNMYGAAPRAGNGQRAHHREPRAAQRHGGDVDDAALHHERLDHGADRARLSRPGTGARRRLPR